MTICSMFRKPELPEVEPVRLRPVLGLRPGVFILLLSIAAAILLLFIVAVLPGLVSATGYVRFSTNTVNTAIYEDGRYIGSSEGSVYRLDAGDHTFSFYVDGAYAGSVDARVPHRIFFTLFVHRTDTIRFEAVNSPEIEKAVTDRFAREAAAWSQVIDYDETYHCPPLFTDFATNASALGFEDVSAPLLYGALHITSGAMHQDFLDALGILSESGVHYRSTELDSLIQLLGRTYIDGIADDGSVPVPMAVRAEGAGDGFFSYEGGTVSMGNGGAISYPASNGHRADVKVNPFSIAALPVTEYEYALFMEQNPYWAKSNKSQLIADGMADEGYLDGISPSRYVMSSRPIRSVSWYAAEAYCRWISEETGIETRLPEEAEWYAAARSADGKPYSSSLVSIDSDTSSPSFMMGQVWEMTGTPYIPLMRLSDYGKAVELGDSYPYDGIIIKGGSYINADDGITADTVGVMEKSQTSPFVGFRVCRNVDQADTEE